MIAFRTSNSLFQKTTARKNHTFLLEKWRTFRPGVKYILGACEYLSQVPSPKYHVQKCKTHHGERGEKSNFRRFEQGRKKHFLSLDPVDGITTFKYSLHIFQSRSIYSKHSPTQELSSACCIKCFRCIKSKLTLKKAKRMSNCVLSLHF